ncbi:MAG: biotin/lipoyl-binding protein [Clostridia bacterium]|nr:biotin/lipoyl-binding protein [Clostridia bacterium]MDY3784291.1 biotin/lipoyl-containing protein [Eubacteriales bacterium]
MKKYKVTVNGTAYEVTVEEMDASSVATENTAPTVAPVQSAAKPQETKKAAAGAAGAVKVKSPMAGTILKVLVNPGDAVKRGQTMFILEALKMENNIPAPVDGVVSSVDTKQGAQVNTDEVVATLA